MPVVARFPAYLALVDTVVTDGTGTSTLWAIRAGQDFNIRVQFNDDLGVPDDITGTTWKFVLRRGSQDGQVLYSGQSGDGAGVGQDTIAVEEPGTDGAIILSIPGAKTISLPIGSWYYTIMNTTGGQLSGWVEGPVNVQLGAGR
jgi:hypothetical protein